MNDKEMDDYVEEIKEFVVDTKTGEKVHQEMYKQRIKDLVSWWMRRSVKRIELFCACKLGFG